MTIKREFVYIFFLMLLFFGIVTVLTIFFYDSNKAVLGISVASTLISIVLAVLAIAYTFIDSAAQRANSLEIKSSADRLAATVNEEKDLLARFSEELIAVTSLKDELIEKITETHEWRLDVVNRLKALSEKSQGKESFKIDEIDEIMIASTKNSSKRLSIRQRHLRSAIRISLEKSPKTKEELLSDIALHHYSESNNEILEVVDEMFHKGYLTVYGEKMHLRDMQ